MLQQTTVAAVIPYFERFLARFPDVGSLARADQHEVLALWAGLGYYARGRNLHACARAVAAAGGFPGDLAGLRALPGIGAYTASAIAAIAFGTPTVPVDGNVERVTSRLFAIETPLPQARPALARLAATLGDDPDARAAPSDFAQALFDLGATICTPRRPACALCPWREPCAARRAGMAGSLPLRTGKPDRKLRHGAHFWLQDEQGRVLLRRRPSTGLFAGMTELPGTAWRPEPWSECEAHAAAPARVHWLRVGTISHTLTHLEIRLDVYAARVAHVGAGGFLVAVSELAGEALPTIMRKCADLVSATRAASTQADGSSPQRHQQTAGNDEETSGHDRDSRPDVERHEIDELSGNEEQGYVDPQQSAEIPTRRVDDHAIGQQHETAGCKEAHLPGRHAGVQSRPDDRVPACLQRRRNNQDH